MANYHSRTTRNGTIAVNRLKHGPLTVLDLWKTLLEHIAGHGGLQQAVQKVPETSYNMLSSPTWDEKHAWLSRAVSQTVPIHS
jgi:hypothetical protein